MSQISLYKNVKDTLSATSIHIDMFLDDIKNGRWLDDIIEYRAGRRKKETLPCVTLSGEFSKRNKGSLSKHSGFICIDIDNLEDSVDDVKDILSQDIHVYAAFKSVSEKGLAVLFRIHGKNHERAFLGISEYLYKRYGIIIDQACKDVSRLRFVSHDSEMFINQGAAIFTLYPPPPPKAIKSLQQTVFVKSDFDEIINQINTRCLDLVDDYQDWLRVAFAFTDKFGENGREYFHIVSQQGNKYDSKQCDKQYDACLTRNGNGVTIGTFYWMCKKAGIEIVSRKTDIIATAASNAFKGGRTKEDTIDLLKEAEGISEKESKDIVNQVFDNKINYESSEGIYNDIENWLKQNYNLRRNILTRKLESDGVPVEEIDLNTMYLDGKKVFGQKLNNEVFTKMVNSKYIDDYNPLLIWLDRASTAKPKGQIKRLCNTIQSTMPRAYIELFVTKWLIGIIESIHGEVCPLMLVLSGRKQNTGKTEWFRRLLPHEIRSYYAESQLDKEKDDEILMTQKLLIMNDEMGGNTARNFVRLKNILSKKTFTLREPYGKANVDLRRLAVLAGTSNDNQLLNDPTGNRRIIPIQVSDIDKDLYNDINKADLFAEVYWLWKEKSASSTLSNQDIAYLNSCTTDFEEISVEAELIEKWFEPEGHEFMTTTDIKTFLEQASGQRISVRMLGMELSKLGYERISLRKRGAKNAKRGYMVYRINKQ